MRSRSQGIYAPISKSEDLIPEQTDSPTRASQGSVENSFLIATLGPEI